MSMLALRPTFSESWYRVASLKVRLRPGAQISRQFYRGERWYVVRDPAGTQFMRLSDGAYHFVGLLDGRRTVAEAWELAGGQMDDAAPTQPEVIQILSQLHQANLVEADITPDAQVLLRRHKAMVRRQWQQRAMSALFPRIPIPFDLNGIVTRWMPAAQLLFSKVGVLAWCVLVISAIAAIAPDWRDLGRQSTTALAVNNWMYLWAVFVFTKVIHEFGHAFACRKFGGEVHEMGIMFLVFIPTPYVDASSAWGFPSRWQRMFVGLAGMFTELAFASLMAFVWKFTNSETSPLINGMAYNAMLVASVSTVLFNANPLLRYDGYYILSDFLEIPNLQQKSKEYGWGLIKRHVFRIKQQQPLPPLRQRLWLFNYWWASSIYRVFIGVMIILIVSAQVPVLGTLMMIGGVITWCVVPVFTLLKYLIVDPELHRKRGRAWAFTLAMATLIFICVGLIKAPVWVWSEAIIEPESRVMIRAEYDGFVKEIRAVDQQTVEKGQVLLVLENRTLESQLEQARARLRTAELRRDAMIATDQTQRLIEEEQITTLQEHLAELERRERELTIRAPFAGRLIAPILHTMEGQYVHRGRDFAIVASLDRLEARAIVEQDAAHYTNVIRHWSQTPELIAQTRDRIEIRLIGALDDEPLHPSGPPLVVPASQQQLPHPSLGTMGGGTAMADPRDERGVRPIFEPFEIVMKVDNVDLRYVPGQRAHIRFTVGYEPIIKQAYTALLQLIQVRDLHNPWS